MKKREQTRPRCPLPANANALPTVPNTHAGACGKRVRNEMQRGYAHIMLGQTKRQTQEATSKELLARCDRTSELRRILCKQILFRTNTNDGIVTTDIEPKRMNKQPISAVQPVAHSPWQKERLTHSQPREKPRHRKETQSSWMKHNMAAANLDSKMMSVVVDLGVQNTQSQRKKPRFGGTLRQTMCSKPRDWRATN